LIVEGALFFVDQVMIYLKIVILGVIMFLQSCGVPLIPGI